MPKAYDWHAVIVRAHCGLSWNYCNFPIVFLSKTPILAGENIHLLHFDKMYAKSLFILQDQTFRFGKCLLCSWLYSRCLNAQFFLVYMNEECLLLLISLLLGTKRMRQRNGGPPPSHHHDDGYNDKDNDEDRAELCLV